MQIGLALGVFSFFIFTFVYSSYLPGVLFLVAFSIIGFLKCNPENAVVKYVLYGFWTFVCISATVLFPYYVMYFDEIWESMAEYTPGSALALNALLITVGVVFFFVVTANWRGAVITTSALLSFFVVINSYIFRFRGKELIFSDLFSAKTAFNVARQYDLTMPHHILCAIMLMLLLLFLGFCLPRLNSKVKFQYRLAALALDILMATLFCTFTQSSKIITWNSDGTLMNGYYMNFYISIRDYFVEKPDSYSLKVIENFEQQYDQADNTASPSSLPNILVIMNESFADLSVLGSAPRTDKPVTPFLDSLQENTISGHALTSVYGGTTANAEFEFLTSFTLQFLPNGATPYQQYIQQEFPSLAWILKSYGYQCTATHPYLANGWSRPKVYPLLGFSERTFLDAYPAQKLVRDYIGDQEMYEYLLQKLNEERDSPIFLFGITMQNHGGYGTPASNFSQTIHLEGYSQDYPQAEVYLSLINQSDLALEYLLTELEQLEEDTLVLFFGDHLPKVENEFYEELHGSGFDTLDSQMQQYTVPFFIWANYDIPEGTVERTSLNYLARYLLEAAGIELPPYYRFLKDAEAVIPAVNALGYYSNSAQSYLPVAEAQGEEAKWLNLYDVLQYNGLFDRSNRSQTFFGTYIDSE